jgi:hypothetical protein
MIPLTRQDQKALAAAMTALLQAQGRRDWRPLFAALSESGRAALATAEPEEVLETAAACWTYFAPKRWWPVRGVVHGLLVRHAAGVIPQIEAAQAELRSGTNA